MNDENERVVASVLKEHFGRTPKRSDYKNTEVIRRFRDKNKIVVIYCDEVING